MQTTATELEPTQPADDQNTRANPKAVARSASQEDQYSPDPYGTTDRYRLVTPYHLPRTRND